MLKDAQLELFYWQGNGNSHHRGVKYTTIIIAPAIQNIKVALDRMLRCVMILTGMVAVPGIKT